MIFEQFNLSTEILMVNMLRNDAVILNPENPDERIYQPPHARRPVFDTTHCEGLDSTAVTQAGLMYYPEARRSRLTNTSTGALL